MATEATVRAKLKELGMEPLENKCIVVQYAAPNLSEKLKRFLIGSAPFYVLQICQEDIVLAPLNWEGKVKGGDLLQIPLSSIQSVNVVADKFDYQITLVCDDGNIDLVAQQKELSILRSSGMLTNENAWGTENWHSNNLTMTLKALETLV